MLRDSFVDRHLRFHGFVPFGLGFEVSSAGVELGIANPRFAASLYLVFEERRIRLT